MGSLKIRVPLYIGNIGIAIQVNAGFSFYGHLENSRHLDATYTADNQSVTKSYEKPVPFFVFVICIYQKK